VTANASRPFFRSAAYRVRRKERPTRDAGVADSSQRTWFPVHPGTGDVAVPDRDRWNGGLATTGAHTTLVTRHETLQDGFYYLR
jgi:hypothetical protein